jgi:spore germination protein YaaH
MQRLRTALLAAIVAGAAIAPVAPIAQAAPARHADQMPPRIMSEAASMAASPAAPAAYLPATTRAPVLRGAFLGNARPQREVFGFVNASNLGNPSVGYPSWNFDLLTTVAYFALQVNSGDGQLVTYDTGWQVFVSSTMTNFVADAHAHGVRVVVSLNLHDFGTSPTGPMCLGLAPINTQHTITAVMTAVTAIGIDGVSIDYEGTIANCFSGMTNRDELTAFVKSLRAAMPSGMYLGIDTYSGSAEDNQEFFDISSLGPYVDSFFVMAYDMDYANSAEVPLNCTSYCFNPMSPINTYRFNVSKTIAQYTALVPGSKVVIGQPLYGRRGCVPSPSVAHQYPIPNTNFVTTTYFYASTIPSQSGVFNFAGHRDPLDGVSEWDTWYDTDFSCTREQYFDDVYSLGAKFDLINRSNIRGVGFFSLDYAGGAPELWSTISTYFSCPVNITLPATETTTQFAVNVSASCSVAYFEVQEYDTTLNQGWQAINAVSSGSGAAVATAEGYPGHTYDLRARAHTTGGVVSSWSNATTSLDAAATSSLPFKGLYSLDGWGGVHSNDSSPLTGSAYWPGWNIARTARALPGASAPQSGFVLDGYGGLHPYGAAGLTETSASNTHYWPGWNIARDFAFLPDGTGGFVLDGYGGLHPFRVNGNANPLQAQGGPYWAGSDLARKVVIFADGSGGYVLDAYGGLHPFGINGPPPVAAAGTTAYWSGWDIARDVVLTPGNGNHSGYVLDGYGGVHPFHPSTDGSTMPATIATAYWPGTDLARSIWLLPGSATAGYTLDAWGGPHPFGGAPAIANHPYWPGWDIVRVMWGA